MTNHSETTGSSGNGDLTGGDRPASPEALAARGGPATPEEHLARAARSEQDGHDPCAEPPDPADHAPHPACHGTGDPHQITLRSPAELADALPYLLGYRPEDSIVLVALHDRNDRGHFGGRARLGIPASTDDWPSAARQLAHGLVTGSERRDARPERMVAYLCQEPSEGETGRQVMERLRPLAQRLRVECGTLDVPVIEALCVSDGRFWSYCCVNEVCCPAEGTPMGLPGTSVLAAAAAYAGIQVRGTLRELRARLLPWENAAALEQETALDTAGMSLVSRILDTDSRAGVAEETLTLAGRILRRLAEAPPVSGTLTADLRDDELITHDEAATLILGLQDRTTRDRAAEWMEGDEAAPALRLWRALARRCVGPYGEHAAAPLTLTGWVAWSTGDELEAREALAMALGADPDYLFARLLHQACNEGLDAESVRRCLRTERRERKQAGTDGPGNGRPGPARRRDTDAVDTDALDTDVVDTGVVEAPEHRGEAAESPCEGADGTAARRGGGSEGPAERSPAEAAVETGAASRRRRRTRSARAAADDAAPGAKGRGARPGPGVSPRRAPAGSTRPESMRTGRTRARTSVRATARRHGTTCAGDVRPPGPGAEGRQ
ncbi:hypothetical protein GCM10010129_61310 [Streptomyces fumigatiscleroticus]|nr:hypothetical protein GCM10010129_61310 [Streptomyces fumigatiscleroticus]